MTMEWSVNVMTDEQVEVLRKQIAAYATICELLVEMHKRITTQQDSLTGMRMGSLYPDPLGTTGHKITARQRWTPTPMQLQILENHFSRGNGTPSKQKIKEMASELTQHGPITEINVYNWFQNRRARSKRKMQPSPQLQNSTEPNSRHTQTKKARSSTSRSSENLNARLEDCSSHTPEISSSANLIHMDPAGVARMASPDDELKSTDSLILPSFYDSVLTNHGFQGNFDFAEADGCFGFSN